MLSDSEYFEALGRINKIFYAEPNTSEGEELEKLVDLVIEYGKRLLEEEDGLQRKDSSVL